MTNLTSAKRSLSPTSAGGNCLHYGQNSTEIVGVGLVFHPVGGRRHEVVVEPVFPAISDRRFLSGEVQAPLRPGVARAVPAGQRIRAHRLLPFELEQPAA